MQLALPATPKPGEGGSEVEWVRAVPRESKPARFNLF